MHVLFPLHVIFLFLCNGTTCWRIAVMQHWLWHDRPSVQFLKWQQRFNSVDSISGSEEQFHRLHTQMKIKYSNPRAKLVRAVCQTKVETVLTEGKSVWVILWMYWTEVIFSVCKSFLSGVCLLIWGKICLLVIVSDVTFMNAWSKMQHTMTTRTITVLHFNMCCFNDRGNHVMHYLNRFLIN